MVCYETLRKAASQRLKIKLPRMTEEEVRKLLNVDTHGEVHKKIDSLNDTELFILVSEAIRRKSRRQSSKAEEEEIAAYA
jgi:hypothetical protein